jgi:hypothetical protein
MPAPGSARGRLAFRVLDMLAAPVLALAAPAAHVAARLRERGPLTRAVLDRAGLAVLRRHYYEPALFPGDVDAARLSQPRDLPGLDLNAAGQLAFLAALDVADELAAIPREKASATAFGYDNDSFLSGDAEVLYGIVRRLKPRRLYEVGSGNSTLMARLAIEANRREDPGHACEHVCIEPFEQPWLESLGVRVVREKVETLGTDFFGALGRDDILFVDSSHVIRPQGDVLFEVLSLFPRLAPGVLVHVHDIFTPRDYLPEWVMEKRFLWNEQYLIEAYLSHNRDFEIVCALNWLWHAHREAVGRACPVLASQPWREPASFWFRRV